MMTLAKFGVKAFSIFVLLASVATTAEARKVQMAVATFSQSVLPMVVAQEKGYYREERLRCGAYSHDCVGGQYGAARGERRFHL